MAKILGIIPARYASTRFPGKPLALIDGKTMIRRVYEGARAAGVTDELIVATDDERIANEVKSFGGLAVMTSPGHVSGTERCLEALGKWEKNSGILFDYVINIQGDEPYIRTDHLVRVARLLRDKDAPVATLAAKITSDSQLFDPNTVKVVMAEDMTALYFSRSPIPFLRDAAGEEQSARCDHFKHVGIYGYRADILRRITRLAPTLPEKAESLEQLRWLGHGIRIHLDITELESISIDVPEDLLKITNRT